MRYVLTLFIGLILGGVLIFVLFVGAPRAKNLAGLPVRAPEAGGDAPGTAVLLLDEQFFDQLLNTIFRDLGAPKFPLRAAAMNESLTTFSVLPATTQFNSAHTVNSFRRINFLALQENDCPGEIQLVPEGSNVKTGVRLVEDKIIAPLAFSGSYNVFGTCYRFRGVAETNIALAFNAERQTLYGQVSVAGVDLTESPLQLPSALVTPLVQEAINGRVNPIEMLRAAQLALNVPVQATGGTLKAQVKDVRSEVKDNALRLHITYDFSGARGAQSTPQQTATPQS